jgi:hypothetical protein
MNSLEFLSIYWLAITFAALYGVVGGFTLVKIYQFGGMLDEFESEAIRRSNELRRRSRAYREGALLEVPERVSSLDG